MFDKNAKRRLVAEALARCDRNESVQGALEQLRELYFSSDDWGTMHQEYEIVREMLSEAWDRLPRAGERAVVLLMMDYLLTHCLRPSRCPPEALKEDYQSILDTIHDLPPILDHFRSNDASKQLVHLVQALES